VFWKLPVAVRQKQSYYLRSKILMKKCPRCGVDNSLDSVQCSECSAPLQAAQQPTAYRPAVAGPGAVNAYKPAVAGPNSAGDSGMVRAGGGPLAGGDESSEVQSVVGQPLGGYQGPAPGGYAGPKTDPYGTVQAPPRMKYHDRVDDKPVKYSAIGSYIGPILTLIVVLAVGVFLYWKFVYLPKGPLDAMRVFVPSAHNNDVAALQSCITKDSMVVIANVEKAKRLGRSNINFDFFNSQNEGFEEGKQWVLKVKSLNETSAKILVKPGPAPNLGFSEESLPARFKEGYEFNLVKEGEAWKVDLQQFIQTMYSTSSSTGGYNTASTGW